MIKLLYEKGMNYNILIESIQKVKSIVESLDKHKARDIEVIYVHEQTTITDYFVIATGSSTTMVKSLSDYVEDDLEKLQVLPTRKEGYQGANWILIDYNDVIIHLFLADSREFYGLERLWSDGKRIPLDELK